MFRANQNAARVFIQQFTQNPIQVGSIFPSSQWLASKMMSELNAQDVKIAVEYGPGTGSFTSALYRTLAPECRYVACEPNRVFCELLKLKFPRAEFIQVYADALQPHLGEDAGKVDLVISGLPFSLMKWETVQKTIASTHQILRPGGQFRTFVYFHTMLTPPVHRLIRELKTQFTDVTFNRGIRNFPPAVVIRAVK